MGAASRQERARQLVLEAVEEYRGAAGTEAFLPARAKVEVRLREFEQLVRDNALSDAVGAIEQLGGEE